MIRHLKDLIAYDAQEVFLELGEFAEWIELDGMIICAQVQYRTEKKSGIFSQNYETLHGDFVKVFFRTADYCRKNERLPVQGEEVHINKKRYRVLSSKDEFGITRLVASAYRQTQLRGVTGFQRLQGLDD